MPKQVRCKFMCVELNHKHANEGVYVQAVFLPRYDTDTPEDQRFSKATPNGRIELTVTNPDVLPEFKLGKAFYFDMHEVPT